MACLGGAGEIGMNLYVYESESSAVVVDYGIMFADPQMCGIDWIMPDITYLETIRHKVKAVLFTHGHEDHIGGVLDMARLFSLPIYTGRFTAELVMHKTRNEQSHPQITVIEHGRKYEFGDISAVFFPVAHSIPDTCGIILEHNGFTAVHLSDFLNACSIKERLPWGRADLLLLDSTNAMSSKEPRSEQEVHEELVDIFSGARARIFLTTFASNVARLDSAIKAAKAVGRKVVIEGAAMERTVAIASRLGYIYLPEHDILTAKKAHNADPASLVYLVSGCQGEVTSALHSIAMGERKAVRMVDGDMLIFSSRAIPGNESSINAMINETMRRGVEVLQSPGRLVHISGHASVGELLRVMRETAPKYFAPIHGEYRHLAAHAKLAAEAGIPEGCRLSLETGEQLVFENGKFAGRDEIPSGRVYIDNRGGFVLNEADLSARKHLARDGLVLIDAGSGKLSLSTYGFKLTLGQEAMILSYAAGVEIAGEEPYEDHLVRAVKRYFRKFFNRRPLVEILKSNRLI